MGWEQSGFKYIHNDFSKDDLNDARAIVNDSNFSCRDVADVNSFVVEVSKDERAKLTESMNS